MRNVLLGVFSALFLFQAGTASAQILTQNGRDTSISNYTGCTSFKVYNRIKSGSSTPLTIRWSVVQHNLQDGSGWDISGSGVCDNYQCYSYLPDVDPNENPFAGTKRYTSSTEYNNVDFNAAENDFHVVFSPNNPPNGSSAFVRVSVQDIPTSASRTLTFIATKSPTGVSTFNSSDDVVLYPNPARDAINVVYDQGAGVKTIAVYNLIGKLTGPIYKPAMNGSAKISLDDMPSGVYFLRLMDAHGRVIATRRFTHQ